MASSALPESPVCTALQAALGRLRRRAPRAAVFMLFLCSAIGVLLSAIDGGKLQAHLIYAFAVGGACWAVQEGTRLVQAGASDRLRRARGLAPDAASYAGGWKGTAPAVVATLLLGPVIGIALGDFITGHRSPSLLNLDSTSTRLTLALTFIGSVVALVVLSTQERLSGARAQAEAAQRQAAEHQLRLLQSQLEPHMLFNTLANLRVLIGLDPPRAQAMLDRLIAFLRSTLAASRVQSHPLAAEFERTADYLALMAVRMGPRLQTQLHLPPELGALPVPPLLLQPLVENCIQHGLEPKVDGGRVDVTAAREGPTLVLTVRDTGVGPGPAATTAGGGFGLTQVRERLATLYGERASVRLEPVADAEGGTLVTLRLPLEP